MASCLPLISKLQNIEWSLCHQLKRHRMWKEMPLLLELAHPVGRGVNRRDQLKSRMPMIGLGMGADRPCRAGPVM